VDNGAARFSTGVRFVVPGHALGSNVDAMATTPPAQLTRLLARQRLVVHRDQAIDAGVTERWLRCQVEAGRWQKPMPSVYFGSNGTVPRASQEWSALLFASDGGRHVAGLCGPTAAALDGLSGYGDKDTHVLIDVRRRLAPRQGLQIHRVSDLGNHQLHPVRKPTRTRTPRAVVEAALGRRTVDDAVALLAAAVQQGLVLADDLLRVFEDFPRVEHRRILMEALADIAGGSHSLPEVQLRRLIKRAGLPLPDRQSTRYENGRRRYLDNFWDSPPVILEVDGALHLSVDTWWDDMWRDAELTLTGHRVFRVPALAVRLHEDRIESLLRRALLEDPRSLDDAMTSTSVRGS
jgi:hypothetical protein